MKKNKRNKYILLIILILICLSIGYAFLNSDLLIKGNSNISKSIWDVHFDNIKLKHGSVSDNLPEFTLDTITINTTLNKPGDFYAFTFDLVNAGTIDAMVESIDVTTNLTEEQSKYINHIITYDNGNRFFDSQIIFAGDTIKLKTRIEFNKEEVYEDNLPDEDLSINVTIKVNYAQTNLNTFFIVDSSIYNPIPGMTLYDSINNICSGDGYGDYYCPRATDYYVHLTDGEYVVIDENGKVLNLEDTIVEAGKKYEAIYYSRGAKIGEDRIASGDYITIYVDVSHLIKNSWMGSEAGEIPVFMDSSDTYKDLIYAIYPDGNFFEESSHIETLQQELIGEYMLGFPSGQEVGCGSSISHNFFWFEDEDGNILKLTDNVNPLERRIAVKYDIPEYLMTWEQAKIEMRKRLNNPK